MKDLTAFLTPNLSLKWRDRVFEVEPPSREDGLILAALNAVGMNAFIAAQDACTVCGRSGAVEPDEKTAALIETVKDKALGEISLGAAYQEMVDAGVSGPDLELFELYAFYYWTLGEKTADAIIESRAESRAGEPAPKAP